MVKASILPGHPDEGRLVKLALACETPEEFRSRVEAGEAIGKGSAVHMHGLHGLHGLEDFYAVLRGRADPALFPEARR